MEKEICRIHVLKRFNFFEWGMFAAFVFLILFNFNFIGVDFIEILVFAAIFFMVLINKISFRYEIYSNFDIFQVNRLLARRYKDLLMYFFWLFVFSFLVIPVVLYILIAIIYSVIVISMAGFFLGPFVDFFKFMGTVGYVAGAFVGLLFYAFVFTLIYHAFIPMIKRNFIKFKLHTDKLIFFKQREKSGVENNNLNEVVINYVKNKFENLHSYNIEKI